MQTRAQNMYKTCKNMKYVSIAFIIMIHMQLYAITCKRCKICKHENNVQNLQKYAPPTLLMLVAEWPSPPGHRKLRPLRVRLWRKNLKKLKVFKFSTFRAF